MNSTKHSTAATASCTFLSVRVTTTLILASVVGASLLLTACKTQSSGQTATPKTAIRINAGATAPYTDSAGNTWLPDQGFVGGRTSDRGNIEIAKTQNPALYRTEHYGMTAFSQPVPNGNYTVKLHFAETYEKITAKGQRIFSVKVEDQELKELDVLARAGAPKTALVESFPITVADGKLDITFTAGAQNPEINGIEILSR